MLKEERHLEAYQIGFDLVEVATQGFNQQVRQQISSAGYGTEAVADGTPNRVGRRNITEVVELIIRNTIRALCCTRFCAV